MNQGIHFSKFSPESMPQTVLNRLITTILAADNKHTKKRAKSTEEETRLKKPSYNFSSQRLYISPKPTTRRSPGVPCPIQPPKAQVESLFSKRQHLAAGRNFPFRDLTRGSVRSTPPPRCRQTPHENGGIAEWTRRGNRNCPLSWV